MNWSLEEITYLIYNYDDKTPKECAEYLERSVASVKQKAVRLGIAGERRSFTDSEILFVKENYPEMGAKALAESMGLKKASILGLAKSLNLKMTSAARGKISTRTNTGHTVQPETRAKIGNANRKYWVKNYCADCGVEICKHSIRCKPCELKSRGGEQHPWWNGGVTKLYQMVAHVLYQTWKKPILERDKFLCQHCGSRKNLEVHHLRRFVEIRDCVIIANQNLSVENYDDRVKLAELIIEDHRLEDGVTLCRTCHKKCHWEKQRELLENPNVSDEGNQHPSRSNVVGLVDRKVQRLTAEESTTDKADTSALHTDSHSV